MWVNVNPCVVAENSKNPVLQLLSDVVPGFKSSKSIVVVVADAGLATASAASVVNTIKSDPNNFIALPPIRARRRAAATPAEMIDVIGTSPVRSCFGPSWHNSRPRPRGPSRYGSGTISPAERRSKAAVLP